MDSITELIEQQEIYQKFYAPSDMEVLSYCIGKRMDRLRREQSEQESVVERIA
jgi:hypothetical protein